MDRGHNNPPGMIETAKEVVSNVNIWLTENPVIETEEKAREAKAWLDRSRLCSKDLMDEQNTRSAPFKRELEIITDLYQPARDLLRRFYNELKQREIDYIAKEEARRIHLAEEARRAAEAARSAAQDAEKREAEAKDDARHGVEVDLAAAVTGADAAFQEFRKADRAARLADRESKARIGGGFGRAFSLKNKEVLSVADACAAIMAIGMTEDIEEAILRGAKAYRKLHDTLPPGIESKTERTA